MKTVKEVCEYLYSVVCDNPICAETGSTYCVEESNLIHTTTNNIANRICLPKEGSLFSFDIDAEHQELAKTICDDKADVTFVLGDSVDGLKKLAEELLVQGKSIDILCLDSKEFDEDHMVNEYLAVKHVLSKKHFVLADDIHNDNSVKWVKMVPILKDLGYKYVEISTPTGLFLSTIGYDLKI
jgi:hypothetical protein